MQTTEHKVWQWNLGTQLRVSRDHLTVEEPLEIRLDTRSFVTTMRTPGHDKELATGLLLAEGIIRHSNQIKLIRHYSRNRSGNVLDVYLDSKVEVDWSDHTRQGFMSSSCGLCGKTTIDALRRRLKPLSSTLQVKASTLNGFPRRLNEQQETFSRTGGLHAAALFTPGGKLVVAREDVGRHNAVDKVIGYGLLKKGFPWSRHILLVSGRVSFEIVQKAWSARIPLIAAISAPSSLALKLAKSSGQTLVGFLRNDRMNVYTFPGRIL